MRLPIYRKGTSDVIGYAKEITITDKWMEDCYATLVLDDAEYIDFQSGDYVMYNGRVYSFNIEHNVAKNATAGSTGNAFAYSSIKFEGVINELKRVEMLDFTTDDINKHYSWLPSFSFYCTNVGDFVQRVQANLDRSEYTRGKWLCEIAKGTLSAYDVQVSIDKENIFESIKKISTVFGCAYSVRTEIVDGRLVNKLVVEGPYKGGVPKDVFVYGKGNGLVNIERQLSGDSPIVNRIHAYGGTENLSSEYYSGRAVKDEDNEYRLISRDYAENYFKGIGWDRSLNTEGKTGRFATLRRRVFIDMPATTGIVQHNPDKEYEAKMWLRSRTIYYVQFDADIPQEGLQMHIEGQPDREDFFFVGMLKQDLEAVHDADVYENKILDSTDQNRFEGYSEDNILKIIMSHYPEPGKEEWSDDNHWCIRRKDGKDDAGFIFKNEYDRTCLLGVVTCEQQYSVHWDNGRNTHWEFEYVEGSETVKVSKAHAFFDSIYEEVSSTTGCLLQMECDRSYMPNDYKKVDLKVAWLKYYGLRLPGTILNNVIMECSDFDTSIVRYYGKMYSDTKFSNNALSITRLMLPDFAYLGACRGYDGRKMGLDVDRDAEQIASLGGVVYIPFTSRFIKEIYAPQTEGWHYKAMMNCVGYDSDGNQFAIYEGDKFYVVGKNGEILRKYDTCIEETQSIDKYGVRESSVYFDSDDAANNVAKVFPTFKGMYTDLIKAAGYPISEHPNDNGYVDEVLGGCKPLGYEGAEWDDGTPIDNEPQGKVGAFYFYIKDPGFNLNNYENGTRKIHFTSGECEGREYEIKNVKYVKLYCNEDGSDVSEEKGSRTLSFYGYRLECNREADSSLGNKFFPNSGNLIHGVEKMSEKARPEDAERELTNVKHSDTFVITGIFMPRVYVDVAAQRLKKYAEEYINNNCRPRYTFTPKLNNVFLQRDRDEKGENCIANRLVVGSRFFFDAAELSVPALEEGSHTAMIIDSLTIKDGTVAVPEYSIVLKEVKEYTMLQKLKMGLGEVDGVVITSAFMQSKSAETNSAYISGMVAAFVESCLSKYDDDVAEGHITFTNGLTSNEVSTVDLEVEGESTQEEIHSADFEKGFKGHGLYKDDDGKWHFETDVLNVRGRLEANEIVVQESRHIGGEIMLTAAGCELAKVIKRDNGDFVCLYRTDDGVTIAGDNWEVGDQAFCEAFNVANSKVDETNYTQQRYWRLVTEVGSGISIGAEYGDMRYIVLSGSDCEEGSTEPMAGDSVVQLGNRNYADGRTGCTIISGAGTRMGNYLVYEGITRYVLPEPKVRISPDKVDITADNIKLVAAGGEKSDLQQELERLEQGIESVDDMLDNKFDIYHIGQEAPKNAQGEVLQIVPPMIMGSIDRDLKWNTSEYEEHIGDFALFSDGVCYRFDKRSSVYAWYLVTDAYLIDYVNKLTEQQRIFDAMADDGVISMQEKPSIRKVYDEVDNEFATIISDATYVGLSDFDKTNFERSARGLLAMLQYILQNDGDIRIDNNTPSGKKLAVKITPDIETIDRIQYRIYDVAYVVPYGVSLNNWRDYYQIYQQYVYYRSDMESKIRRQTYQRSIEVTTSQDVINEILRNVRELQETTGKTEGTVATMETGLGAFFTTGTSSWGVKESSGLLTTSNFASLFSTGTLSDGRSVAATIAAYINAEGSGIVLNADKIDFSSYSFNLKTHDISIESVPFNLNNEKVTISTDNFKLDEAGNVDVKGVIRSNQMYTETNTIVVHDDEIILGSSDQYKLTNTIELRKESTYASGIVRMPDAADYKGMVVRIHGGISTNGTSHGAKIKLTMWNKDPQYSRRQIMFTFTQDTVSNLGVVELLATSEGWAILHTQNVEISGLN